MGHISKEANTTNPSAKKFKARAKIASAMSAAAIAMGAAPVADAKQVTITVDGIVTHGTDFKPDGTTTFGLGTTYNSAPFELKFKFDDQKGLSLIGKDAAGNPNQSILQSTSTAGSPGTANLTINGVSVPFGANYPTPYSNVMKSLSTNPPEFLMQIQEGNATQTNVDDVEIKYNIPTGTADAKDYNWESTTQYSSVTNTNATGSFILKAADGTQLSGNLVVNSIAVAGTTPPTVLQLAQLSQDVYLATPNGNGAYSVLPQSTLYQDGLKLTAYQSADNSQIVIAVRGTDPTFFSGQHTLNDLGSFFKNLASDSSFVDKTPSQFLKSAIPEAVGFIQQVHTIYPDAHITLTGHSLGGGIAELLGAGSGLDAYGFNAPGGQDVFGTLATSMNPIKGLGNGEINQTYRLYDDQISQAGTQFSQPVTLPYPEGLTITSYSDPVDTLTKNFSTFLKIHSMDSVVQVIGSYGTLPLVPVSTAGEFNVASSLSDAAMPKTITTDNVTGVAAFQFLFDLVAEAGSWGRLIDPADGKRFTFTVDQASPKITCVELPTLDGVASYNLYNETSNVWSAAQVVKPGDKTCFAQPVTAVEFDPLDKNGQSIASGTSFFFKGEFASGGTVNATLTQDPNARPADTGSGSGSSSGSSGGGSMDPSILLLLPAAWALRRKDKSVKRPVKKFSNANKYDANL